MQWFPLLCNVVGLQAFSWLDTNEWGIKARVLVEERKRHISGPAASTEYQSQYDAKGVSKKRCRGA